MSAQPTKLVTAVFGGNGRDILVLQRGSGAMTEGY